MNYDGATFRNREVELDGNEFTNCFFENAAAGDPQSVQLTMARWHEPKRTEIVSALDLYDVAHRLNVLSNEAFEIGNEIFEWRIRVLENERDKAEREFAERYPPIWLKIAKGIKNGFNRLLGRT